ncbi:MAG: M50 family metallopeptidase, partial [Clostridiales bacterium]
MIFCVLVISHEFGHFIAAKSCGIYVTDFSMGMGPKLVAWKGKETQYTLRLLPIGGWCKMIGEDEASDDPRAFNRKPIWQRMLVVVAGPLMNFLMAIVIFIIVFMMLGSPSPTNVIGEAVPGTEAEAAGLKSGDKILEISGVKVNQWTDISTAVNSAEHTQPLVVTVERDGALVTLNVPAYQDGKTASWKLGVQPQVVRQNIFTAIALGVKQSIEFTRLLLLALVQMITGQIPFDVAGPVGIVKVVDQAAAYGIQSILLLTGYLCINLGVLNLLPFPALDGCRLLFLIVEGIRRKPFDRQREGLINLIGLAT